MKAKLVKEGDMMDEYIDNDIASEEIMAIISKAKDFMSENAFQIFIDSLYETVLEYKSQYK